MERLNAEVIKVLEWTDKVDGDDILADDINAIARETMGNASKIGDIDTALDNIIAIQESLIGGETA